MRTKLSFKPPTIGSAILLTMTGNTMGAMSSKMIIRTKLITNENRIAKDLNAAQGLPSHTQLLLSSIFRPPTMMPS
jgi:hypothetical protein